MDLPIEVPLTRPVVVGDQTYDKLLFDEPDLNTQIAFAELEASFTDSEWIKMEDGSERKKYTPTSEAKVSRFWISRLSGVPEAVAGKIKDSDLAAVNAAASAILGGDTKDRSGEGHAGDLGNETPAK